MKSWMAAFAGFSVLVMSGCDWEGLSEGDGKSNRYDAYNFTGSYAGVPLVSAYTTAAVSTGEASRVRSETIGTIVAGQTVYHGVLARFPVTDGTVQIVCGSLVVTDDGSGALQIGGVDAGSIVYASGAWNLTIPVASLPSAGTAIKASYTYTGDNEPSSSGKEIFVFNVDQDGNNLTIVDNTGAKYTGKISSIRGTGGASVEFPGAASIPADGEPVTATFSVSGRSSAGLNVTIVGSFGATASVVAATETTAAQVSLNDRAIHGTWIESGGKTGNVNGTAQ